MKLSSLFAFDKVSFDKDTTTHLLLKAEAPKLDLKDKRPALNLVVALDKSSSMMGKPIDYVKKSAHKLVEHLSAEDRLGIITFDHNVYADFEPMLITPENKEKARKKINDIYSSGSTNFSGAMLTGLQWSKLIDKQTRLIILTDGQPTAGETRHEAILNLAKANRAEHVTLTAFGYGEHHEEVFLRSLSEQGKGNYAYIQSPDDALKAFARELGGLMSCYAQNLKFKVTPKDGVEILRVVSDVDVKELDKGAVEISVNDLYSEEIRNLVLEVKLPKQTKALPRDVSLFDVSLEYTELQSGEAKNLSSKAKIAFVKPDEADKDGKKEVLEQVAIAEIADGQKRAQQFADVGDYSNASKVFRASLAHHDYATPELRAYASTLSNSFENHNAYTKSAKSRGAGASALRTNKFSGGDFVIGASNATMDAMVQSFSGADVSTKTDPSQTQTQTTQPPAVQVDVKVDLGQLQAQAQQQQEKDKKPSLSKSRRPDSW